MNCEELYENLTGVNIKDQEKLWDERGRGYYGEFLVFCELYNNISGNCKILMNLNIPTEKDKTTEIDLLLIHETGIYVLEIKHYKGTIYGDDKGDIWTQYFRTTKNSTFRNPILQNEYHINNLKKILNNVPIKSMIVFTNNDCNLRVENKLENVCLFRDLSSVIQSKIDANDKIYSPKQIDDIFQKLSVFSNMQEKVEYEGKEEPFVNWLEPIIKKLETEKNKYHKETLRLKTTKRNVKIVATIIIIICIVLSGVFATGSKLYYDEEIAKNKEKYNEELNLFKQNFKHIDEIGNEYINRVNDFVNVSNIDISQLSNNIVSFTARLSMNNDVYGITIGKNAKYIVMTNSKMVYEYNVFGNHLSYNYFSNNIGKGINLYGDLAKIQFYGVSLQDITYIKITDITLFKTGINRTIIKENLELELYNK